MNPRVSLLALTLILFSCSNNVKEETPTQPEISKILISELDTFYGGKNILYVTDTTESGFRHFLNFKADTSEANNLKTNKEVKRIGDTLFIALKNNSVKQLISKHYVEGEDQFTEYKYFGTLNSINYHLFFVALYEGSAYLMINAENGKETYMCGKPAVSPDKKYLVSSNCDLQAQFDFNGLQMYDITKDSLRLNWDRGLNTWGADNVAWMDNHTLLVEKMYLDTNQNVHTGFVKISCVQK